MSEISSGLVAVAYIEHHKAGDNLNWERVDHAYATASPLVRLSDAEAIIAQKDAEILEQCRINGMGAEREATLLGKVERQSAALKLARQVLMSVKETSSSTRLRRIVDEPLAAIHEVLGEVK
jgi:hypothetical protein